MPRHFVFLLGRKLLERKLLDKGMKMHDAVAVSDQSFSILLCAQDLLQKAKEDIRRPSEVNFTGLVFALFCRMQRKNKETLPHPADFHSKKARNFLSRKHGL
jgi:hypothetical protein